MNLLFTATDPENPANILLSDTNFEAHYPGIDTNTRWVTIHPYVRQATQRYIIPLIGPDMYVTLAEHFNDENPTPNSEYDLAISYLQDALANYTIYLALPHLNIVIGDLGVGQNRPSEGNFNATGQWQYKEAQRRCLIDADAAMDLALAFFESVAGETDFEDYANAAVRAKRHPFFRTLAEMQQYINIKDSLRAFLAISRSVDIAWKRYLQPIVGYEMYQELIEEVNDDDLSGPNADLLEKIQPALALYALWEAIPGMAVQVDADGIRTLSATDGFDMKDPASAQAVEHYRARLLSDAKMYRAEIAKMLYDAPDDYPTWRDSGLYRTEATARELLTSNDRVGGIML
jgi:hypothetical protein